MPTSLTHRQRGQMLLEGRRHPRHDERFIVQVSSAPDPLVTELASVENHSLNGVQLATERSWELGSHVDVKAVAGNLKARARVVYCNALGPKKFVVGLNILSRDGEQADFTRDGGSATGIAAQQRSLFRCPLPNTETPITLPRRVRTPISTAQTASAPRLRKWGKTR